MVFKTTTAEIKRQSYYTVCAGYCEIDRLLTYTPRIAYTAGCYGWNYDVYEIDGLVICTGYRGMPGKRIKNAEKYEKLANKILCSEKPYSDKKKKLDKLLSKFVEEQIAMF